MLMDTSQVSSREKEHRKLIRISCCHCTRNRFSAFWSFCNEFISFAMWGIHQSIEIARNIPCTRPTGTYARTVENNAASCVFFLGYFPARAQQDFIFYIKRYKYPYNRRIIERSWMKATYKYYSEGGVVRLELLHCTSGAIWPKKVYFFFSKCWCRGTKCNVNKNWDNSVASIRSIGEEEEYSYQRSVKRFRRMTCASVRASTWLDRLQVAGS